jgi:hypothetical protein
MVARYGEIAEIEEFLGCGGLQSSISNIITFEIDLLLDLSPDPYPSDRGAAPIHGDDRAGDVAGVG